MQTITVELCEDHSTYQSEGLPDWHPVGTVRCGDDVGALVQHRKTKRYALAREGEVHKLDQRRILAALGKSPARKFNDAEKFTAYLPRDIREKASRIGGGNISNGLRLAVIAFDEGEGPK